MLKAKYKELEKLMAKNSKFGAIDSEPMYHMGHAIALRMKNKKDCIPQNADQWELYCDMDGVEAVAKAMTEKLVEVLDAIPNASLTEVRELARILDIELHGF
jgi:hypothetical protein